MISDGHFRAGSEEGCIPLTPGEQDPHGQRLAPQPTEAYHKLSQPHCFSAEGIFLLKGQKNTPLTGERKFNLRLHTRKAKSGCLAAQSSPSSPRSSPSSGGRRFPGDHSRHGRPCSGCFARATATPGASHAELSAREAKAGSSRGQAAIIIKPTSVHIA